MVGFFDVVSKRFGMRKSVFISIIVLLLAFGAGVLIWERQQKEAQEKQEEVVPQPAIDVPQKDHVLARAHKTGVIDLDGPYKKVSVSNNMATFSFEVPDDWLTETRSSGEVEMNEEELRDFFATSYSGDIKTGSALAGDYWDFTWDMLKNMPYDEMKRYYYGRRDGFGYPNATVSSDDKIWYTDMGWDQVHFYILDKKKNANFLSKVTCIEDVSQAVEEYKNFNAIFQKEVRRDEQGAPIIDKGDSWGFRMYIEQGNQVIYIEKEAYMEGEFEDGFWHMLQTLQIK